MPHLNNLAEEFRDRPVRFLSVTDESEEKVRAFLDKRPMRAWVGLDTTKATFKNYGVRAIPHTVLVDPQGRVAAVTSPQNVTAAVLEDLLAGRPLKLEAGTLITAGVAMEDPGSAPPLLQVLIRATDLKEGMSSRGGGALTAQSMSVSEMLRVAYGVRSAARIQMPEGLPESVTTGRYQVVISSPSRSDEQMRGLLRSAIQSGFGLSGQIREQARGVLVVTVPEGGRPGLTAATDSDGSSMRSGPGTFSAANQGIDALLAHAERILGLPVVDKTGLKDRYDYEIQWDADKPESLVRALESTLGLAAERETLPIDVLVVERNTGTADAK
jgi:uncharacterized protein (TIGR03435 family)